MKTESLQRRHTLYPRQLTTRLAKGRLTWGTRRGVSDPEGIYKVAQAYAVLGDKNSALHMLRHSIGGGFFCYPYFVSDPLLQSLWNEQEFKELLTQARQRHEKFKSTFF
jgi:hypothetical protein